LSSSKDVEEFLAYNGGAEIEFVQENIEFIPPAVRLDKVFTVFVLLAHLSFAIETNKLVI